MIRKGDKVTIKPEWQDDGDDQFDWFAAEDSRDDRGPMPRLRVIAIHKDPEQRIRWRFHPVNTVDRDMLVEADKF